MLELAPVEFTEAHEMASENERTENEMSAWITVKAAAEILGVTVQGMRWLINEGRVNAQRFGGKIWMVDRASVEAYAEKRQQDTQ
jgi:excisionase family DNA binding protein